ncbi:MAG: 1,4-dihydroxy-2-naphthoate octaprenyltransferase [Candidatus Marinimicrobia bacterium CG1_02_48_14]|nr:MAG: 1,4-dihydroxy-2-naphthoate octaprenyltransferase [Candidatus Marinimicrobia bacterium CG1_02_48_14]
MTQNNFSAWILASRPKTLPAAISPVLMGTTMAFADGGVHWLSAFLALFGALMIQIGTNLANDYFDHKHGKDTQERLGPMRVTQAGLVSDHAMKLAISIVFTAAFVAGIYLVYRAGWPIVIIGLLSLLFGMIYTAGPFPLAYLGIADLFAFLFFGPIALAGTYYAQTLDMNWVVLVAGIAPGCFSIALLTVNNLRDVDEDRGTNKKTLIVRLGKSYGRSQYLVSMILAALIPIVLWQMTSSHSGVLITLLALIFSIPAIRGMFGGAQGRGLNQTLAQTGKTQLIYTLLFIIGWLI